MDKTTLNRWMCPSHATPFASLPDGTPLFPAFLPLRRGECHRRSLGLWTGQTGEWVGVTLAGQLYSQSKYWGSQGPDPTRWQPIIVPYC